MSEKQQTKHRVLAFSTIFIIITAFYMAGSVVQNIFAGKNFLIGGFTITDGGTLISWAVFLCMDIVTEVWGKKKAQLLFWISAALNLFFTGIAWLAIVIPGNDPEFGLAYEMVLGTGWRIAIASITAFLLGNYANMGIMYVFRLRDKEGKSIARFIFRAIFSTLVGQLVDNAIFYLLAFSPIGIPGTIECSWAEMGEMILFTTLVETGFEAVISPLTAHIVRHLKKRKVEENIITDIEALTE